MKKEKLKKRLVLNKATVADLSLRHMGVVKGGDSVPILCIESMVRTCECPTAQYNCTTQDPNQICVNTCNSCDFCNTTQGICRYTIDCC